MESGEILSRFKLKSAVDINDTLRGINAVTVDELAYILKLPDRLSIAEAIQLELR